MPISPQHAREAGEQLLIAGLADHFGAADFFGDWDVDNGRAW